MLNFFSDTSYHKVVTSDTSYHKVISDCGRFSFKVPIFFTESFENTSSHNLETLTSTSHVPQPTTNLPPAVPLPTSSVSLLNTIPAPLLSSFHHICSTYFNSPSVLCTISHHSSNNNHYRTDWCFKPSKPHSS